LKDYYRLLDISATSSDEEVKRAFRQQIARYHPDKVHHLAKEFQEIAATRTAELTEAYHVLSDVRRRAEYDRTRAASAAGEGSAAAAPPPASAVERTPAPQPEPPPLPAGRARPSAGPQFREERASRDELLRKAILERFRQAFSRVAGAGYDESSVRGFDVAWLPKDKRVARGARPRLVGKLVSRVDATAVADAWDYAAKWNVPAEDEICVILMGTAVASQRELAAAIASQRKRPTRGAKVTLIPVNMNVWDAFIPTDAPPIARDLLARLRDMN
jgi:curved DNA-binding protein CbpA